MDYLKQLSELSKQRELYKLRNDAQRYLQLGEQTMYERVAPLVQKPVTEKLEEVKQVLKTPQIIHQTIHPQAQTQQQVKNNFEPIEVFDKIVEEINYLPSKQMPADSVRLMKTKEGYSIGSNPIEVIFHEQGRDIKMNDFQIPFSEDLEKLLQMQKVLKNGEELKEFKIQTLQDYVNLLRSSKSPHYRISGNFRQAERILKDNPPGYRVKPGDGLDFQSAGLRPSINEAQRVLTLLAAKSEGHNNVDKELAQLRGDQRELS